MISAARPLQTAVKPAPPESGIQGLLVEREQKQSPKTKVTCLVRDNLAKRGRNSAPSEARMYVDATEPRPEILAAFKIRGA